MSKMSGLISKYKLLNKVNRKTLHFGGAGNRYITFSEVFKAHLKVMRFSSRTLVIFYSEREEGAGNLMPGVNASVLHEC